MGHVASKAPDDIASCESTGAHVTPYVNDTCSFMVMNMVMVSYSEAVDGKQKTCLRKQIESSRHGDRLDDVTDEVMVPFRTVSLGISGNRLILILFDIFMPKDLYFSLI